jgi:hypothetical protein
MSVDLKLSARMKMPAMLAGYDDGRSYSMKQPKKNETTSY